jgi:hypothetical protein
VDFISPALTKFIYVDLDSISDDFVGLGDRVLCCFDECCVWNFSVCTMEILGIL